MEPAFSFHLVDRSTRIPIPGERIQRASRALRLDIGISFRRIDQRPFRSLAMNEADPAIRNRSGWKFKSWHERKWVAVY
jgi:hypothetical protein